MSFKIKTHTSESADTVFADRKKEVLLSRTMKR